MRDALAKSPRVLPEVLLTDMVEGQVKAVCERMGIDPTGRKHANADPGSAWRNLLRIGTTEQGASGTTFRVDYLKPSGAIGFVPDLFWHEMHSTLLVGERKGRIDVGTMNDHMQDVRMLSIETDARHADDAAAALSRKHGLSGYDAAYLETAIGAGRNSRHSTRSWLGRRPRKV